MKKEKKKKPPNIRDRHYRHYGIARQIRQIPTHDGPIQEPNVSADGPNTGRELISLRTEGTRD
jgi:hypothetical protein